MNRSRLGQIGVRGIEVKTFLPEGIGDRRHAHRRSGMAGFRLLDRVDRQRADRVDAETIKLAACSPPVVVRRMSPAGDAAGGIGVARVEQQRDQPAPAGLVRRAQPGAGLAVIIFVEQQMVAKIGVVLQQAAGPQRGPAAVRPSQVKRSQPIPQIIGNFRSALPSDRSRPETPL